MLFIILTIQQDITVDEVRMCKYLSYIYVPSGKLMPAISSLHLTFPKSFKILVKSEIHSRFCIQYIRKFREQYVSKIQKIYIEPIYEPIYYKPCMTLSTRRPFVSDLEKI